MPTLPKDLLKIIEEYCTTIFLQVGGNKFVRLHLYNIV